MEIAENWDKLSKTRKAVLVGCLHSINENIECLQENEINSK